MCFPYVIIDVIGGITDALHIITSASTSRPNTNLSTSVRCNFYQIILFGTTFNSMASPYFHRSIVITSVKMWHQYIPIKHYTDVIMGAIASQITSLTIVYSFVYSDADQRKHQSSASLAFVWGIHREPVNYLHKWPVTRKMFPFGDVIMKIYYHVLMEFTYCRWSFTNYFIMQLFHFTGQQRT